MFCKNWYVNIRCQGVNDERSLVTIVFQKETQNHLLILKSVTKNTYEYENHENNFGFLSPQWLLYTDKQKYKDSVYLTWRIQSKSMVWFYVHIVNQISCWRLQKFLLIQKLKCGNMHWGPISDHRKFNDYYSELYEGRHKTTIQSVKHRIRHSREVTLQPPKNGRGGIDMTINSIRC